MAKTKQQALTRIDNNYEINLRYPDINDFLKDTFFSLQDNQTLEQSLVANTRISTSKLKEAQVINVGAYVLGVDLTSVTMFAFSENQELLYDFKVIPVIFDIELPSFTASRVESEALLQSIESYSTTSSNQIANFNIKLSSRKIASILTTLFTTYKEQVKSIKELATDQALVEYVQQNLFNESIQFYFMYRFQDDADYDRGYALSLSLGYLREITSNLPALQNSAIVAADYSPSTAEPTLKFNSKFRLAGSLKINRVQNNLVTQIDNTSYTVAANAQSTFTSTIGTRNYIWETINGLANNYPTYTYGYVFTPSNTSETYVGLFPEFKNSTTSNSVINCSVQDYAVYVRKPGFLSAPTQQGSLSSRYVVQISFTLTSTDARLKSLFNNLVANSPALGCTVEFLENSSDSSLITDKNEKERLFLYSRVNTTQPVSEFSSNSVNYPSVCSVFSTAATTLDKTNFTKLTQRLKTNYDPSLDFTNTILAQVKVDATLVNNSVVVSVTWPPLSAQEMQTLHQLTTAAALKVELVDAFLNVLATATGSTNNVLLRQESPLVIPTSWYNYSQISSKVNTTISGSDIVTISGNLLGHGFSPAVVAPVISVFNNSVNLVSNINYTNSQFNLLSVLRCLSTRLEKGVVKWCQSVLIPTSSQITITATTISVSSAQKASIVTALWGKSSNTSATVYVLLPFKFARNLKINGVDAPLVFTELVNYRYYYGYAIKV